MNAFWDGVLKGLRRDTPAFRPRSDDADRLAFELATLRQKVSNIADAADRAREHMLACPSAPSPAEMAHVFGVTAEGLRNVLALPTDGSPCIAPDLSGFGDGWLGGWTR